MARLKAPASRLTAPRPKLAPPAAEAGMTAYRQKQSPWRAWYKTARWHKLRWQVLRDAGFICAMCGKAEMETKNLVCDHIVPHRGNERLFWDRSNLQCLDKHCHDSVKQKEERRQGFT